MIFLFMVAFALFSQTALSLTIDVGINEKLACEVKEISESYENGLFEHTIEFYNSGSVPYSAIARMDLLEGEKVVFTMWSDRRFTNPGQKEYFRLYAYTDHAGQFRPRIRVYFGNEIMEKTYPEQTIVQPISFAGNFNLSKTGSGKDFVEFEIVSGNSLEDVIIAASNYPPGWIFFSDKINLEANVSRYVRIAYEPDKQRTINASLLVISKGGVYVTRLPFAIGNEDGINLLGQILSFLGSFFQF